MSPLESVDQQLRAQRAHWRQAVNQEYRTAEAAAMRAIDKLLDQRWAFMQRGSNEPQPTA